MPYYSRVAAERLAPDAAAALERLKYTVQQAGNAPIYAGRLGRVSSLADLTSLPLTTKQDLKSNPAEGFLAVKKDKVWHYHESFGTTGDPVVGWYTLDDIEVEIDVISRWLEGFQPGATILNRYPYAFPVPAQLVETGARLRGGVVIPASNLTWNVNFPRVLNLLDKMKPQVLAAMPLEATLLREAAEVHGRNAKTDYPSLQWFVAAGRIMTPSWMAAIEEDWNVRCRNLYGTTEGGPFATSCGRGNLHLHEQGFLFEILDPQTKQPVPGEQPTGTLVVTTLLREAQPMIRYWTDDLVRVLPPCPCGDSARCIEVLGRAGGLLRYGGVEVTAFDIEEQILQWTRSFGSNVFFVVVTHRGFVVRVEAAEPGRVDASEGARRLQSALGVPVRVEVEPRGTLINHVSLVQSPQVFKPRTLSDHRVEDRRVINLSGGLVDMWHGMNARLLSKFVWKSIRDFFTAFRLRLFG